MAQQQTKTATQMPDPRFVDGYIGWFFIEGKGGRGMVALKPVPAGTVMERNPVIVMPNHPLLMDGTDSILENYMFRWGPEDAEKNSRECIFALGNIALVNHSSAANADTRQDHENGLFELFALRDIAAGEEITIDYDTDLWFEVKE